MSNVKIGVLGAGNMGGALLRGLLGSSYASPEHLRAADVDPTRLAQLAHELEIQTTTEVETLARWAEVLVLAIKPQVANELLQQLRSVVPAGTLVISMVAGLGTSTLESFFSEGVRVVRAMPNSPALVGAGMTAVARGSRATAEDLEQAHRLFDSVGRTVQVEERLLDAVTGLSGSGPAYVLLAIEALADGGVSMGLGRATALLLAAQTVMGTAKMVLETGDHPARLKDSVVSPGGTTIAGLEALESAAVRHAFIAAVRSAAKRSAELGRAAARHG